MSFRHSKFLKLGFFPVPCQFDTSAILMFRNHRVAWGAGTVIVKDPRVRTAHTEGRRLDFAFPPFCSVPITG